MSKKNTSIFAKFKVRLSSLLCMMVFVPLVLLLSLPVAVVLATLGGLLDGAKAGLNWWRLNIVDEDCYRPKELVRVYRLHFRSLISGK